MGNYLKMADKQRIQALLELGWSYRRIQRETGVHRETVARYDPNREPKTSNPSTGSESKPANVSTGPKGVAEPYREVIEAAVAKGLTAQRIWQDLRDQYPPRRTPTPRSSASSAISSALAPKWPT